MAELPKTPPWATATLGSFYRFAEWLLANRGPQVVLLVADDGGPQLAGIYAGVEIQLPYYDSGTLLNDQFFAAVRPGAMQALLQAVRHEARLRGCNALTMGCMSTRPEVTARWGRRLGLQPLTLTLFEEV